MSGSAETSVTRVSTDSRQVQAGDLFIAITGDKFDGHDFVAQATDKKVAAVMVERARAPKGPVGCAVIAVEHTRKALGQIAAAYRKEFALPVVADRKSVV